MSEWDDFIDQIRKMGIDQVIEVYEAALTRYYNRGK